MSYLTAEEHKAIIADPNYIEKAYVDHWRRFAEDLGPVDVNMSIGGALLPVAFASVVAWDLKRYGIEPASTDLTVILNADFLACDNYARLTWYFSDLMYQTRWTPIRIAALGVHGGPVGNHAQMFANDGTNYLFLDPTIGLVARDVTFDSLFAGKPVAPEDITTFERFNVDGLEPFRKTVKNALLEGKYRASNLLYYIRTKKTFMSMPSLSHWLTPAAEDFWILDV